MEPKTLLLVEDNPDDEALTLRALRRLALVPMQIEVARDGVEALERMLPAAGSSASTSAPRLPDLVLLDLKMPRMSGLQVLEELRKNERTRTLPVVVFTSSSEERDLKRCYELGANAYVRKPVDFTEFVEAVGHLGLFWLTVNEPPVGDRRPPSGAR